MKVSGTTLKRFSREIQSGYIYEILGEEIVEKEITHKIPYECGVFNGFGKDTFPKYLEGFREYYTKTYDWQNYYHLINPKNRPNYTIKISFTLYDVEFTEKGKEIINEKLKRFERSYNTYKKLAEGK